MLINHRIISFKLSGQFELLPRFHRSNHHSLTHSVLSFHWLNISIYTWLSPSWCVNHCQACRASLEANESQETMDRLIKTGKILTSVVTSKWKA